MPAEVYHKPDASDQVVEEANGIVLRSELHYLENLATEAFRFREQGKVKEESIVLGYSMLELARQDGQDAWAVENGDERPKKIPVRWNDDSATGVDYA